MSEENRETNAEFRGMVKASLRNIESGLADIKKENADKWSAINSIKKDLVDHKVDGAAHGMGTVIAWSGVVLALATLALEVWTRTK